jgi:hypothetical protein
VPIATTGLAALFIAVVVQGVNSDLGSLLLGWRATPRPGDTRPRPNPQSPETEYGE